MPRRLPHFRYEFKEPLTNNTAVFMNKYIFRTQICSYCFNPGLSPIVTAHVVDLSVFAGVFLSMK